MASKKYHLHLKGFVGGWDFDSDYVDYILEKFKDSHVDVLIDSTGGYVGTALSVASAFRRHGDVSVHLVGLNASAATIASLGAKHISIDKAAMYLVHKCSSDFFKWARMNSDQFDQLIKDLTKTKENLDKFDINAASQYAARCKKKTADMLELMAKEEWLTASEALEWGFVDEITTFDDEKAPEITEGLAEAMAKAGMPVPVNAVKPVKESGFIASLKKALGIDSQKEDVKDEKKKDQKNIIKMEKLKLLCAVLAMQALDLVEGKSTLNEDQLNKIEAALSEKDAKISELNSQIEDLKSKNDELKAKLDAKPADESSQVVDDKKTKEKTEKSDVEEYVDAFNNARDFINMLK